MTQLPNFKRSETNTDEEKAILELADSLRQTHMAFLKLNCNQFKNDSNLFKILRDGALSYCGLTIDTLSKMLADKNQLERFIDECTEIFKCYMRQALEDNKQNGMD